MVDSISFAVINVGVFVHLLDEQDKSSPLSLLNLTFIYFESTKPNPSILNLVDPLAEISFGCISSKNGSKKPYVKPLDV